MDTWNEPIPVRKGMPTWAKVLMGCGIVAALAAGACVVGGVYVFKKGRTAFAEATAKPMAELAQLAREGGRPEGLAAFLASHPGLAKRYPDAQAFQAALKDLPERVGPVPPDIQDFVSLLREKRFEFKASHHEGRKTLTLKYRNPGKDALLGEWEDGQLVDVRIE